MTTTYPLTNIVDLAIQLDAFPISRRGFGTPLFIGTTDPDPQPRVQVYTSLASVAEVYATDDPEYQAAAAYFGQNPKPAQIAIGFKDAGETYVEALTAIRALYDDWFFLTVETRAVADQTALAAAVSAIAGYRQAHFVSNATADVMNNATTTDIGAVLRDASRLTCFAHYHQDADLFPELALLGRLVISRETGTTIPGSIPAPYQAPAGITPTSLTDSNRTALGNKRYTYYQTLAQQTRAFGGRSGNNVPFDVVYFLGWLSARIPENVAETITRAADRGEKIPFNDIGIAQLEAAVREVLNDAVTASAIEPDYTLTVPTRAETSFSDRAARLLNDVRFEANITGAIERVGINGVLIA